MKTHKMEKEMNANRVTIIFGLMFGAIVTFSVIFGLSQKFQFHVPIKWYTIFIVLGAGVSLFFGAKKLVVGQRGVLSVLEKYLDNEAVLGIYFELPGIIGIMKLSAKQTTIRVNLPGAKLKGSVTLVSAQGSFTYVVRSVRIAGSVDNLDVSVKALCESALRTFITTQSSRDIENGRTDLLAAFEAIREGTSTKLSVLVAEADSLGVEILSLFLDSAELPPELVKARNQQVVEAAERIAQGLERSQREGIIREEMLKGATYAEAQAEADRVTGKRSTVTTNQVTGGGQPVVLLGQNQGNTGNGGTP